jgi:hypothetical protein
MYVYLHPSILIIDRFIEWGVVSSTTGTSALLEEIAILTSTFRSDLWSKK